MAEDVPPLSARLGSLAVRATRSSDSRPSTSATTAAATGDGSVMDAVFGCIAMLSEELSAYTATGVSASASSKSA